MYEIYAYPYGNPDAKLLLYRPNDPQALVLSPKLTREVSKGGSLVFTMTRDHAQYDMLQKLSTVVQVRRDGKEIWRGRVLKHEADFYNRRVVYCEGALSYFNDSSITPFNYKGTLRQFLQHLIDAHNDQVKSKMKCFQLGTVTAALGNLVVQFGDADQYGVGEDYGKVWDILDKLVLKVFGGYFYCSFDSSTGLNVLNYCDQAVEAKGTYNVPFIFTGNVMRTGQPHIIDTHFLYCNFKAGLRFENNDGIYPYFNNCTVCGDFIVDEIQSVWQCDFSKANLITNRGRERFPEARFTRYDPAQAGLDNDQAVMDGGYALLKAHDVGGGEEDTTPNEPVYDISADPHYNTAENAVIFDGTFGIDTGVQLFATNKDFTIIASFQLESFRGLGMPNFSFVPVFSSMNYSDDKGKCPGFDVGLILAEGISADTKPVGGFITTRNYWGYSQCPSIDMNSYSSYPNNVYNLLLMRKNGVLKFYDFYMQTYGEVTGNDATAIFDGTLHIGENMAKPNESAKYKMRGKVYQCKVYNKALPTKLLEEMFPNIYSNESRIKGSITCYVNNLQYLVRIARCTYLEVTLDLGKHAWPEYAGKYPKAVGIKVTGLYGFDDVIWVGTGTDGHITKWIYNGGNMKPHEPITVTIANTGLCPGLEAKLIAFRCVNLTEDSKCVPATGIGVNWAGPLTIAAGGELKGEIVLTPAGANTMKDFKMEATGDSITASTSGTALIVRGISPGSATITVTHIGGAVYTCTINVT